MFSELKESPGLSSKELTPLSLQGLTLKVTASLLMSLTTCMSLPAVPGHSSSEHFKAPEERRAGEG